MSARASVGDVGVFLAGLSRQQGRIVKRLRHLVRRVVPKADETVLWRSLSYHRPSFGGRIKGAVCLITPRPDCVELGFIHGAALSDPSQLLHGAGKAKRFVPLQQLQDIQEEALSALIRAAAQYDPRSAA